MSALSIRVVQRNCVCQLCDERVAVGSRAFALEGVHVPPKQVNLFFHIHCLSDAAASEIEKNHV